MYTYTQCDCDQTGAGCSLKNKVVAVSQSVLPDHHPGQLFFCIGGDGADPNPIDRSVFLVSLSNGEVCTFQRQDVIGTLKPVILPEEARLQLSQIRPSGAVDQSSHAPYSGYSFLPDGRYAAGVWLCSPQEVMDYVEMQKPYQHRVLICDQDDFAVMEVEEGQTIFPTEEDLEAFRQAERNGGMEMK